MRSRRCPALTTVQLAYIVSIMEKKEKNANGESGDRRSTRALGVFECIFALVSMTRRLSSIIVL
jgi:hypothetical protein